MTTLDVYASVVTPCLVGNAQAPLLRIVPLKGGSFENVHIEFQNVHYMPMAYTNSRVVKVTIARDNGKPVSFESARHF